MKIKYFGTAAAEGIPALFCECDVCRKARSIGGKEIRTRSQALIDDVLLIDFPADTYMHALYGGLPLASIHSCIITHSHMDHLYEKDLWCRAKGIGNNIPDIPLDMYASSTGYESIKKVVDAHKLDETGRVTANLITPFEPFEAEGYVITPLKATHDAKTNPVFYIIEKDGKCVLYAHDTGFFKPETEEYLRNCKKHFDLVSLDCTNGITELAPGSHMGLKDDSEIKEKLLSMGLCDQSTIFVVNHFSHNGMANHRELCEAAKAYGFTVSYDGLEIEF